MSLIVPVILSGGSGSRLWPLSRELYPKQLLPLAGENTMLQETALRVSGEPFAATIVICNEQHRFLVAEQLRLVDISPRAIVLEPVGRNTAPAAAIAAMLVQAAGADASIMILPSDHTVHDPGKFRAAAARGLLAVAQGALVTFGIQPDKPETGYGYIRRGDSIDGMEDCFTVDAFVEKPDSETAKAYLSEGCYLWNSGMFLFSHAGYLEELSKQYPEMIEACRQALDQAEADKSFIRLDGEAFARAPSDSIDYAVMEPTDRAVVVPVDMGWNDVGAWSALWEIGNQDDNRNVIVGDVIVQNVHGSYIRTEGATVAVNGLDDIVVVATDDALLVADKSRVQDVKTIVDQLKATGQDQYHTHTTVHRPWGWYQTIRAGPRYQVKQICLKPQATISLQMHHHRAEHWVVVEGAARVTRHEDVIDLAVNESVYIPIGTTHRLENPGDEPLKIIEIQSGAYLGEDDIIRFEDIYGRA